MNEQEGPAPAAADADENSSDGVKSSAVLTEKKREMKEEAILNKWIRLWSMAQLLVLTAIFVAVQGKMAAQARWAERQRVEVGDLSALLSHEFRSELIVAHAYEAVFANFTFCLSLLAVYRLTYNWLVNAAFLALAIAITSSSVTDFESVSTAQVLTTVGALALLHVTLCAAMINLEV